MILPILAQRRMESEGLDDIALDEKAHREAMQGLMRINSWASAVEMLWGQVRQLVIPAGKSRLRVLDIATGAGDMPVGLWQRARQEGIELDLDISDRHPLALKFAAGVAREAGFAPGLITLDVLKQPVPRGYDLVISTLFLHHLTDAQATQLLRSMAEAAPALAVMDLRRGLAGVALACLGTPLLTRSGVLYQDAVRSYRAAFTIREAKEMAGRAGLDGARFVTSPSRRWIMTWRRSLLTTPGDTR